MTGVPRGTKDNGQDDDAEQHSDERATDGQVTPHTENLRDEWSGNHFGN
jgi:hypothetical protein